MINTAWKVGQSSPANSEEKTVPLAGRRRQDSIEEAAFDPEGIYQNVLGVGNTYHWKQSIGSGDRTQVWISLHDWFSAPASCITLAVLSVPRSPCGWLTIQSYLKYRLYQEAFSSSSLLYTLYHYPVLLFIAGITSQNYLTNSYVHLLTFLLSVFLSLSGNSHGEEILSLLLTTIPRTPSSVPSTVGT